MIQLKVVVLSFILFLQTTVAYENIVKENLFEQLLKAVNGKATGEKCENAFKIGEKVAECVRHHHDEKGNKMPNMPQCLKNETIHIFQTKNLENGEVFINPNVDSKNFSKIPSTNLQKLISSLEDLNKKSSKVTLKAMIGNCEEANPSETLKELLTNLKEMKYFYAQSVAYNHDVRPFRRLKDAWNSYILIHSSFTGICNGLSTTNYSLSENLNNFEKLLKEQEDARKEKYFHSIVKTLVNGTLHDKEIRIEELKELRNLLNQMFEDLNLFAVLSIPYGNILIPSMTLPSSYLYHVTNREAHILIYPTLPANTYKHVRETDPALMNFNYNTAGPLFGKGPFCNLDSNGSLILTKFYDDIRDSCTERLSCILFESPSIEIATTNANVFLRGSNIDCGWFSSKELYLLAKNTPKNDEYYEKKDKHHINIYLISQSRLNNTVFNTTNPITYDDSGFFKF